MRYRGEDNREVIEDGDQGNERTRGELSLYLIQCFKNWTDHLIKKLLIQSVV